MSKCWRVVGCACFEGAEIHICVFLSIFIALCPGCRRTSILIRDGLSLRSDFRARVICPIVHWGERYVLSKVISNLPPSTKLITSTFTQVLRFLKIAFDRRLLFSIGRSATTGKEDVVIWNSVDHKTQFSMFPDQTYLQRTMTQLIHLGVTD